MKLTPELIENARQYINPVKDRELDLRGYKIPAIENLGATYDQFDTIDLSENDLKKLENFPQMHRLKNLILCNNRICYVDAKLGDTIPNINTVVLTNNNLQELGDLDGLASLKRIEHLSLMGNPVTHKPQYRAYIIYQLKSLRVLDFKRIKLAERQAAIKLFKGSKGAALKEQVVKRSETFNVGEMPNGTNNAGTKTNSKGHSPEELKAIQEAILNAKSLDELTRLQDMLQSGSFSVTPKSNGNASNDVEVEMDED